MRLPFRQGVLQRPTNCLQKISNDIVISTANGPIVSTLSYHTAEYYHTEPQNVNQYIAWTNLSPATDYWLYINIDKLTGVRTFGQTLLAPINGTTQPVTPSLDQHWFDTNTNTTKVWMGVVWTEYIRVFIAKITGTNTFVYNDLGTQVGTATPYDSGRILFDGFGKVIKQSNGLFMTTEDQFFVDSANIRASKLEATIIAALTTENIPAYSIVTYKAFDRIGLATYEDISNSIIAIVTADALYGTVANLVLQGIVTNPNWNWANVNTPLWVDTAGVLVDVDPNQVNSLRPKAVPIARTLSHDTIFIEQGLGGRGEQGPAGNASALVDLATTTTFGIVKLATVPTDSANPLVVGDNDPRLSNARTPTAHTHPASDISYIGHTGLPSASVQTTIDALDAGKLNISGGTMTGLLTLSGNPTTTLQAATKQYVDSRVSGLIWIDPISDVNLVSDALTTPPTNPGYTDIFVVAAGGSGLWVGKDGHMMRWDGSIVGWIDIGLPTAGARIGVAIESSTVPSGTFANKKNNIAIWNSPSWTFYAPANNNAVFVSNSSSLHSFHQYVYSATALKWTEFGGQMAIQPGANLSLSGNIMNVVGGSGSNLNADMVDGLHASDLSLVNHNHDAVYVQLIGGTMTGPLILNADPIDLLEAATKRYVDNISRSLIKPFSQIVYGIGNGISSDVTFTVDPSTGRFQFVPPPSSTPEDIKIIGANASIESNKAPSNIMISAGTGDMYSAGGTLSMYSGAGGMYSQGGLLKIVAGNGGNSNGIIDVKTNPTAGVGGDVRITAGTGGYSGGKGGDLQISSGDAYVVGVGNPIVGDFVGGLVSLTAGRGNNSGFGGTINITSGDGGYDYYNQYATGGDGGDINVRCGSGGHPSGNGGNISITAGDTSTDAGTAGSIIIQSGNNTGSFGAGGSIELNAGTASTGSIFGHINFRTGADPGMYGVWERLQISELGEWKLAGEAGKVGEYLASQGIGSAPIWAPLDLSSAVAKGGDTMTGWLQLSNDPQFPMQAATKQYVDNHVYTIPYDISFFIAGTMVYGASDVGSFLSPRTIVVNASINQPLGVCKTAPVTSVTYTLKLNGFSVGTVSFNAGLTTMTYSIPSPFTMNRGDVLDLYTPSTIEPNIKDVTIILTGTSQTI